VIGFGESRTVQRLPGDIRHKASVIGPDRDGVAAC